MRKIVTAALVSATLILSACNTVKGAGKDLESASDTVKDATH